MKQKTIIAIILKLGVIIQNKSRYSSFLINQNILLLILASNNLSLLEPLMFHKLKNSNKIKIRK